MRKRDGAYPSYLFEELLTGGTDKVVSTRLLQGEGNDRLERIKFDEMVEQIAVVEPEQYSKETESSWCNNDVNTRKHHGAQPRRVRMDDTYPTGDVCP